jgi:hypothetical protein
LIGGYCNSDKLIITISFLAPLLLVGVILFLVVVLRNVNSYPEELDDEAVERLESGVTPLSHALADKIEDVVLPRRG